MASVNTKFTLKVSKLIPKLNLIVVLKTWRHWQFDLEYVELSLANILPRATKVAINYKRRECANAGQGFTCCPGVNAP